MLHCCWVVFWTYCRLTPVNCDTVNVMQRSDTMDSVKQSAALCLLRLYKTSPDLVLMGEWTSRVVHLLNDQHMVRAQRSFSSRTLHAVEDLASRGPLVLLSVPSCRQ